MPESITLNLPSMRRVVGIFAGLVGIAALLVVGIAIGSRLLAADPITGLATAGAVQQVRVNSGAVYVGRIVSSGGEFVRMADPATIRQGDPAAGASAPPRLVVEALAIEPYDIGGELVIPIASVEWVTAVRPGSGLETAYRQAIDVARGAPPVPGSSPSP